MSIKGKYTLQEFNECNYCETVPFELGKYNLISTPEGLRQAIQEIKQFTRIGVDTEQSFQDTYDAFLCLIQISTEDKDYLIDVIAIHDKQLIKSEIEKIFLDKNIIKVFYAGSTDILWLQRDYDIKIFNYFDIQTAATFLNKEESWSLTYLLEKHCDYKIEKTKKKELQLSQWAVRPLTEEQLNYAALDSHFLIKLRYQLLSEMIKQLDFHRTVEFLNKMQKATQKKYEEKPFDEIYYFSQFEKHSKKLIPNISSAIKTLDSWKMLHVAYIELAKLRENYCEQNNKFIHSVLSDYSLLDFLYNTSFDEQSFKLKNQSVLSNMDRFSEKFSKEFLEQNEQTILSILNSLEKDSELLEKYNRCCMPYKHKMLVYEQRMEKKTKIFQDKYSMKATPYENCQILSPDGQQLCNCNSKKINWYLNKGLATLISTTPSIIKLNFQPSGKGNFDLDDQKLFENNYVYVTERENICVVCGSDQKFAKFYVVPSLYRRHFPEVLKSHRSQDILLLCMNCHQRAGVHSDKLIDEICKQYSVDKIKLEYATTYKDVIAKLIKSARSFQKNKNNMPKLNISKFKSILRDNYNNFLQLKEIERKIDLKPDSYFGVNQDGKIKINDLFIQYCISLENHLNVGKEYSCYDLKNQHGRLVVEKFQNLTDITQFILMWRQNFIKTMQPKYLPRDWKEKPLQVNLNTNEKVSNQDKVESKNQSIQN